MNIITKYDCNKLRLVEQIIHKVITDTPTYNRCIKNIQKWDGNPASLYCFLIQKPYVFVKQIHKAIYSI